jgi:hypothetical protein
MSTKGLEWAAFSKFTYLKMGLVENGSQKPLEKVDPHLP